MIKSKKVFSTQQPHIMKKWHEATEIDPEWADADPIQIEIGRASKDKLTITSATTLDEVENIIEKNEKRITRYLKL